MGIFDRLFRKNHVATSDDPRFDRIVRKLVSRSDAEFGEGQTEVLAIPESDPVRLRAIREAIRLRSGKAKVLFFEPNVRGFTVRDGDEILDARDQILRLAERKSLLEDPRISGNLLSTFLSIHGFQEIVNLAHDVRQIGGIDQFHAYQLLYNQNRSSVVLRSHGEDTDSRILTIHEFDDSRARAQRDPDRLQETRGQLLCVKCSFCGHTFVVGEDAVVVTDEDIDWRGSRQPDVIMPVVPLDKTGETIAGASVP